MLSVSVSNANVAPNSFCFVVDMWDDVPYDMLIHTEVSLEASGQTLLFKQKGNRRQKHTYITPSSPIEHSIHRDNHSDWCTEHLAILCQLLQFPWHVGLRNANRPH